MSADHQTALSNLTTLNPADAVALPTREEAQDAVNAGNATALHMFIWFHDGPPLWRRRLSTLIAEIRKDERARCAKYVMSECVQISGDGHLYRLSGAELAAGIVALPEPPRSPDQTAEESK